MDESLLSIGRASELLGVDQQTLRRWDDAGLLHSIRKDAAGHRYYSPRELEKRVQADGRTLMSYAHAWVERDVGEVPFDSLYISNAAAFQVRLNNDLAPKLQRLPQLQETYGLLIAVIGEIGNNSFDHNIGNWPDVSGMLFGYDLERGVIILADRGQGVLKTLQSVRPNLAGDREAVQLAFTEIVTGRPSETRGNGLKFVRSAVSRSTMGLLFESGASRLLQKPKTYMISFQDIRLPIHGCLARIRFPSQ